MTLPNAVVLDYVGESIREIHKTNKKTRGEVGSVKAINQANTQAILNAIATIPAPVLGPGPGPGPAPVINVGTDPVIQGIVGRVNDLHNRTLDILNAIAGIPASVIGPASGPVPLVNVGGDPNITAIDDRVKGVEGRVKELQKNIRVILSNTTPGPAPIIDLSADPIITNMAMQVSNLSRKLLGASVLGPTQREAIVDVMVSLCGMVGHDGTYLFTDEDKDASKVPDVEFIYNMVDVLKHVKEQLESIQAGDLFKSILNIIDCIKVKQKEGGGSGYNGNYAYYTSTPLPEWITDIKQSMMKIKEIETMYLISAKDGNVTLADAVKTLALSVHGFIKSDIPLQDFENDFSNPTKQLVVLTDHIQQEFAHIQDRDNSMFQFLADMGNDLVGVNSGTLQEAVYIRDVNGKKITPVTVLRQINDKLRGMPHVVSEPLKDDYSNLVEALQAILRSIDVPPPVIINDPSALIVGRLFPPNTISKDQIVDALVAPASIPSLPVELIQMINQTLRNDWGMWIDDKAHRPVDTSILDDNYSNLSIALGNILSVIKNIFPAVDHIYGKITAVNRDEQKQLREYKKLKAILADIEIEHNNETGDSKKEEWKRSEMLEYIRQIRQAVGVDQNENYGLAKHFGYDRFKVKNRSVLDALSVSLPGTKTKDRKKRHRKTQSSSAFWPFF